MTIRYDGFTAPCLGHETAGIKLLRNRVVELWPELPNVQGYICRDIAGTDNASVHGAGRAWDVSINAFTPAGQQLGWDVADWLASPTEGGLYYVQMVIWDGWIFKSDRLDRNGYPFWRPFTGANKHYDHIHTEVNLDGAALTEHPTLPEEPDMARPYTAVRPIGGYPVVMIGPDPFYVRFPQGVWDLIDAELVNDIEPGEHDYDAKAKRLAWDTYATLYNGILVRDRGAPLGLEGDSRPAGEQ